MRKRFSPNRILDQSLQKIGRTIYDTDESLYVFTIYEIRVLNCANLKVILVFQFWSLDWHSYCLKMASMPKNTTQIANFNEKIYCLQWHCLVCLAIKMYYLIKRIWSVKHIYWEFCLLFKLSYFYCSLPS